MQRIGIVSATDNVNRMATVTFRDAGGVVTSIFKNASSRDLDVNDPVVVLFFRNNFSDGIIIGKTNPKTVDKFGDISAGNYIQIDNTGFVQLHGQAKAWVDYNVPLTLGKPTAGGKPDYDYTNMGYLLPQNDKTEVLHVRVQLPHAWDGSDIFPHIHWQQTRNQVPVFKVDYIWYNNGDPVPDTWNTYAMEQAIFAYSSGTISQLNYNPIGISASGKSISSILKFKLYREDNVYAGDVLADDFDIHLRIDAGGSRLQYEK